MAFTRLIIVFLTLVLLVAASLIFLDAYTQHRDISVYQFLFLRTNLMSTGISTFTLSNFTVTNSSMLLHGSVSDISRLVSNDVVLQLGNDVIREIIRPSVKVKKYFNYARSEVKGINCEALIQGNRSEILKAKRLQKVAYPLPNIIKNTNHCLSFKLRNGYITEPLSKEEETFPIAFSIRVYSDPGQAEQLLRAIYRPHNVYCVYVDTNETSVVIESMTSLAKCFDNVIIAFPSVSVEEKLQSLESDVICMGDLLKHEKWKYYINLSEQDFPLKTNLEMVRMLMSYNGTNVVSRYAKDVNASLWQDIDLPPYNITPVQGPPHVMVTRLFVEYALHNQTAKNLLSWVTNTRTPEEIYFATLNYNPQLGVPGGFSDLQESRRRDDEPFQTCFQNIKGTGISNWTCTGEFDSDICVFGVADLSILTAQPQAFVSKVNMTYQRYTLLCLDVWLYNKTRDEYLGGRDRDDHYS